MPSSSKDINPNAFTGEPPISVSLPKATAAERLAKIAIVDDEPINIKIVRKHLQRVGYENFVTVSDATQAVEMIRTEQPDIVLLDVMMPQVSGLQILETIRQDPHLHPTPVLILTASTDDDTKFKALNAGATDFLSKPVDPNELIPRLRNALIVKAHHDHLASYSEQLEQQVRVRTIELEVSRLQVVHCLARAAEFRDDTTGRHVIRVGAYASILAQELGYSAAEARMLGLAAQLHDVGKIGLPDTVLLKQGALTPEEYEIVRRHSDIGHAIVKPMPAREAWDLLGLGPIENQPGCQHPLLEMAGRIAHSHHERWDGRGYPRGLTGEAIPREGRITSVADVFDALSSRRPYKPSYPVSHCMTLIEEGRGTQFDPAVLDALQRRLADFQRVAEEQADPLADLQKVA